MKLARKFALLSLVAVLAFMPLQSVYAKGPADEGPIFGGNFTLKSGETLDQDLPVFGGSVTIEKGARLNGSIVVMGGSVTVDGEVNKDVVLIGGSATVGGEIFGNMVVLGGAVKLGEASHIHGDLVAAGAPIDRAEGAHVDGDVVNSPNQPAVSVRGLALKDIMIPNTFSGSFSPLWEMFNLFGWALIMAALAVLVVLFLPDNADRVGKALVAQPVQAGGWGLLTVVLAPVIVVLMFLTLILIPVTAIAGVVLGAALVFGWIGMGMEIGARATKMLNVNWPLPLAAGLGTFALTLVADGLKLVTCVGGMVPAILAILGLGAVFMTRFGTRPLFIPPPVPPAEPLQQNDATPAS